MHNSMHPLQIENISYIHATSLSSLREYVRTKKLPLHPLSKDKGVILHRPTSPEAFAYASRMAYYDFLQALGADDLIRKMSLDANSRAAYDSFSEQVTDYLLYRCSLQPNMLNPLYESIAYDDTLMVLLKTDLPDTFAEKIILPESALENAVQGFVAYSDAGQENIIKTFKEIRDIYKT